jgi:hypothetical protein
MGSKRSRFGYLTTRKHVPLTLDDSLKGVLARSRRKSRKPVTLSPVGVAKEESDGKSPQGKARATAKP